MVPPVGRGVLCGNAAFLMVTDFFSAIYEGRTSTHGTNIKRMVKPKVVATPIFFGIFTPILGEKIHFDEHHFQMGWFNHQLGSKHQTDGNFHDSLFFIAER